MGLDVGGYTNTPDWPKMGPSLLIATCLIVAIRTARWPVRTDSTASDRDLDKEIDFAANVAHRVLAALIRRSETIFPSRKEPWFKPDEGDQPE